MGIDQATSYDEIPYSDNCFPSTHPDHLAITGRIFGLETPPVERCRVLELGCAGAGNLIPMALEFPDASFVGLDLSRRQIEAGRELVAKLALGNVDLRAMSLTDVDVGFGQFDYIICHGVYSWVPEGVRDKILDICSANLAPNGVAFVSYNTYPGWHVRGMVREMLAFHVRNLPSALDRVREARDFLEEMVRVLPDASSSSARILRAEGELLRGLANSYVFHEHLEETNHPMYFQDFIGRAAAKGLRYVAEASMPGMIDLMPPQWLELIDRWSGDQVAREQYADFLCNRTFRRSLLCHVEQSPSRTASAESLTKLWLSSALQPVSQDPDISSEASEEFRSLNEAGTFTTGNPLLKAALSVLREAGPQSLRFDVLWERVQSRLESSGKLLPDRDEGVRTVREALLRCFLADLVDLQIQAPKFTTAIRKRPVASPLARIQAEASDSVTNLRRRTVKLSEFERLVLRNLDGTRDGAAILQDLVGRVESDDFAIYEGDQPVRDLARVEAMFAAELESCLQRLARFALLAG